MKLYAKVSTDKYELPLAVADSPRELARMTGNTCGSIRSMISKGVPGYIKIDCGPDMWPTNDGGLWYWGKDGKVVIID